MNQETKQTFIAEGTRLDGNILSECDITLSGEAAGELTAPSLVITPSGSVHGRVQVDKMRSEGSVSGEVQAEDVELGGRVADRTVIRAKTLEVKLTQTDGELRVEFGECDLHVGPSDGAPGGDSPVEAPPETVSEGSTFDGPADTDPLDDY